MRCRFLSIAFLRRSRFLSISVIHWSRFLSIDFVRRTRFLHGLRGGDVLAHLTRLPPSRSLSSCRVHCVCLQTKVLMPTSEKHIKQSYGGAQSMDELRPQNLPLTSLPTVCRTHNGKQMKPQIGCSCLDLLSTHCIIVSTDSKSARPQYTACKA